nr:hypothetical protein [Tanacetum cinerariifolium]
MPVEKPASTALVSCDDLGGCLRYMTGNISYLIDYKEIDGGYVAFGGNPKRGKITRKCTIKTGNLYFENVYFVRELKFNLFSVSQMWDKKNSVLFNDTECIVSSLNFKIIDESQVLLRVLGKNNITPSLSLMRPFGCHVTILNTKDDLGKFDGKADEGFFNGYSLNSKAFRVFNSRTRIVETNLHIRFSENTLNVVGSGPDWLFVIDALTRIMNYEPIIAGTQSNGFSDPKCSHDDGFKPLSNDGKKVDEDPNNELPFDPNMPTLEDVDTFDFSNEDEDDDVVADINNLDTTIQVSPTLTTRIHKDHPLDQITRDLHLTTQIRNMIKNLEEHGFKNPKGNSCFIRSKLDRGYAGRASLIQVTRSLDFSGFTKWKRAIGTKWVFKNKKDKRGTVIRNKARLVAQGKTQEERIDYDEVFSPVARIEAIRLFLAYASFKDFVVYQMDVKNPFLYGNIKEEVYVCQPPGFEDPDFPDRLYKVKKALYGLHQAPRAWFTEVKNVSTPIKTQKPLLKDKDGKEVDVYMYRSMIGSLMYLTSSRHDIMFAVCACAIYQVNPKVSHLYAVKRIFRVYGKEIIITESFVRRDLQLADEEGVDCLPNSTIFENLELMG